MIHSTKLGCSLALLILMHLSVQVSGQTKILLMPIDDRPATTQFAEMIGAIAGRQVVMPPAADLGRFTSPGSTKAMASWLGKFRKSDAEALVVSADMLAYGGLVASRAKGVALSQALHRLEALHQFRTSNPGVPILAFSIIMRLAPTATANSAAYHDALTRYAALVDEAEQKKDRQLQAAAGQYKSQIPRRILEEYLAARKRNHELNLRMIDMVRRGKIDFLILSQDDAKVYGLHRGEQRLLETKIRRHRLEQRVLIYAGADEVSNVLLSRAILQKLNCRPRVDVVYSSHAGRKAVDPYEDRPLEESVRLQISASGAVEADSPATDYTLFLHAPKTTPEEKRQFFSQILEALRRGQAVAVSDVVWEPVHGGPDPALIDFLTLNKAGHLVRAFASWNTAGNTLGTVIPHANMDVVLRQVLSKGPPEIAEAGLRANLEFLFHRYVNDWGYHDKVRMPAYEFVRNELRGTTVELTAEQYPRVDQMVRGEMTRIIREFFAGNFQRMRLPVPGSGNRLLRIDSLEDLEIRLPWPRPFEVAIRFRLGTTAVISD